MKEPFFTLMPERIRYDKLWIEIRKRNKWLIMLRYGAVGMLFSFILGIILLKFFFSVEYYTDIIPLVIISCTILLYNIFFHWFWLIDREKRIHKFKIYGLRFSLVQICIDLTALMLFIYYTGGVESPLYAFFIFHVIIGSIVLPGRIVALVISLTLAITFSGAWMEYYQIIPHFHIAGWIEFNLYQNNIYIITYFLFFAITLFLSIYLANKIARELYQREKDLTLAYNELAEAEKNKTKYVMSVVHDLKTPISAALTYLNMILDNTLGELKKEHKRPLERSKLRLEKAFNTINDILHISQLKLGINTIENKNIILMDLIKEIRDEMNVLLSSKNLNFELSGNQKDKLIVKGDSKLLKLAFSNLISNSYKYTRKNGKIEVKLFADNNQIKILIADSGIGIPNESKDKIFNDFYRTSISKKEGVDGTGLGMSIVKFIIENYNGKISFESPSYLKIDENNPGTMFMIVLPRSITTDTK
jgi:signal transduction histidine kinase